MLSLTLLMGRTPRASCKTQDQTTLGWFVASFLWVLITQQMCSFSGYIYSLPGRHKWEHTHCMQKLRQVSHPFQPWGPPLYNREKPYFQEPLLRHFYKGRRDSFTGNKARWEACHAFGITPVCWPLGNAVLVLRGGSTFWWTAGSVWGLKDATYECDGTEFTLAIRAAPGDAWVSVTC